MERYFILANSETLSVIGAPFEKQPENSIPYFVNEFVKPVFDVYPNPTAVIEGATDEQINNFKSPTVLEPTKEDLMETVISLETQLNDVKQQLKKL